MFRKLLIANRGEIAVRVIRTARRMGIATVAVHSEADRDALHVRLADEAVPIGPSPARESYLRVERIVAACRATGAEAVHPGYGFLSENPALPRTLEEAGVAFVGPPAAAIAAMGDKIASKRLAQAAGVPTVPGHLGVIADADEAVRVARAIGYPVMIKASAGGGGKGMRVARSDAEAREGFERSRSEAASSFGDDRVFVERFVEGPRHVEVQVIGDAHGTLLHLHERECSVQRRHQKVVEEAPSPFLDAATRRAMGEQAVALARAVGYQSAGTVEFIMDAGRNFYFLEMNTRLQVEHPVTEMITGLDLVELMIRVAAGEALPLRQEDVRLDGWAVEGRVYAEDPRRGFLPSPGRLTRYRPPAEAAGPGGAVRTDTGVFEGGEVSAFYDPMIAKLVAWAPTRAGAIDVMAEALDAFEVEGVGHNLPFLSTLMGQARFREGRLTTGYVAEEFPDGFLGAELPPGRLREVAAVAAALAQMREDRAGAAADPGEWVVVMGGEAVPVALRRGAGPGAWAMEVAGAALVAEAVAWRPGEGLARVRWAGGGAMTVKVEPRTAGFRLRHRGADLSMMVVRPHVAALLRHLPAKAPPDLGRFLLCPMPGQVVRVDVRAGDVVEEGQVVAVVEAMKMENLLHAARRARVTRVLAEPGAVLAVDQVILEFEEA